MWIFLLMLIPVLWPIMARFIWHKEITWLEMFGNIMVTAMITLIMYYTGTFASLSDTATLNGEVISKSRDEVHCRHSYPCHCRSVSCGKNCSTIHCDTCYFHSYDVDWNVRSNVGYCSINTIDSQGLKEPPRWTEIKVHDPFTSYETYTNYIKAAPNSLFTRAVAEQYMDKIPQYPQALYDYYKMDRFVTYGVSIPNVKEWNQGISEMLRILGPQKQANVVILVTKEESQKYADAVAYKWLGGKKNDIVVVVGSKAYPTIDWVRILTWSKHSIFEVKLRDAILEHQTMDVKQTLADIQDATLKFYERKEFKEYKYLEDEIEPPLWVVIMSLIVSLIVTGLMTRWVIVNDVKNF